MAKLKNPKFVAVLQDALRQQLRKSGIKAAVSSEKVPPTKLYRFYVVSPDFKNMSLSERQSVIWKIVSQTISEDDQLRISIILAMTPSESEGRW